MRRTAMSAEWAAGPVSRLAAELRTLRQEAGNPPYRDMSRHCGVPAPTLSRAAAGQLLPTLAVVQAFVRACGQDPEPWAARWQQARERSTEPGGGRSPCTLRNGGTDAELAALAAGREGPRRTRRRVWMLSAALAAVVLGAAAFGYGATRTRKESESPPPLADARRIVTLAGAARPTDPALADLLAVAANRLADVPETRAALITAAAGPERPPVPLPAGSRLTADGNVAVTLGGGRISLLRLVDGRDTTYPAPRTSMLTAVSRDGRTVALRSTVRTTLWSASVGRLAALPGSLFSFGDSGKTTLRYDAAARAILLSDLSGVRVRLRVRAPRAAVLAAVSPDDRFVATCATRGTVQLWTVSPKHRVRLALPRTCDATSRASFGGSRLSLTDADGISVWDIRSGARIARVHEPAQTARLSPDGRHLLTRAGDLISVWRLAGPQRILAYRATGQRPTALSWAGATTVRYLDGALARTLDISAATSPPTAQLAKADFVLPPSVNRAAVAASSADGRWVATGDAAGRLTLWDGRTGRIYAALRDTGGDSPWPEAAAGPAVALAFNHDGTMLVAAHPGGVTLWDLSTDEPTGTVIPARDGLVRAVAFGPGDQTVIVTGAGGGRAIPIAPAALTATLCARAGRDLTPGEWATYLPDGPSPSLC